MVMLLVLPQLWDIDKIKMTAKIIVLYVFLAILEDINLGGITPSGNRIPVFFEGGDYASVDYLSVGEWRY